MTFQIRRPALNRGKSLTAPPSEEVDYDKLCPIFSFRHLTKSHCISKCDNTDTIAFTATMLKLSQLNWVQIRQAHRHGLGTEKIPQTAINAPIPDVAKQATLLAIRFSGMKPMVGFRKSDVFHIVWFDWNFDLYDHS